MPVSPVELWPFFLVVLVTVTILLVAVGAAMIIGHRRLVQAQADFTRRLVEAQDLERARIAAEVHDNLGTHVSLIRTAVAEHHGDIEPWSTEPGGLSGVEAELDDLAVTIRSLAHRLHPSRVDQVGLHSALAKLAEDLQDELDLTVHLIGAGRALPDGATGYAIYRIAQEALRNAAGHGGAREAWVTLHRRPDAMAIEIRDAGTGFDFDAVRSRRGGGIGLRLMRERAGVVGGSLTIESRPGVGTVIRGQFPVARVAAGHA